VGKKLQVQSPSIGAHRFSASEKSKVAEPSLVKEAEKTQHPAKSSEDDAGQWLIKINVLDRRSIQRTDSFAEANIHKAASNAALNQRAVTNTKIKENVIKKCVMRASL
jgi:hypothetical protein